MSCWQAAGVVPALAARAMFVAVVKGAGTCSSAWRVRARKPASAASPSKLQLRAVDAGFAVLQEDQRLQRRAGGRRPGVGRTAGLALELVAHVGDGEATCAPR